MKQPGRNLADAICHVADETDEISTIPMSFWQTELGGRRSRFFLVRRVRQSAMNPKIIQESKREQICSNLVKRGGQFNPEVRIAALLLAVLRPLDESQQL
jgi:hypothetical protein